MTDYDLDTGNSTPILYRLLPCLLPVCIIAALGIYFLLVTFSPEQQAKDNAFEKNWNQIQSSITKMNCNQLEQIRLDKIAGKDISPYGDHWDSVRDTYNTLSCGTMWNWWED